ncbi:carotenoid oxygenase family protein [Candidatus Protochlamydia phocaeensis]
MYTIDTQANSALLWSEEGWCPGEPVFVAAPEAKEDDEIVLAVVLDH